MAFPKHCTLTDDNDLGFITYRVDTLNPGVFISAERRSNGVFSTRTARAIAKNLIKMADYVDKYKIKKAKTK